MRMLLIIVSETLDKFYFFKKSRRLNPEYIKYLLNLVIMAFSFNIHFFKRFFSGNRETLFMIYRLLYIFFISVYLTSQKRIILVKYI